MRNSRHTVCFRTKGNHKQGMGDVMGSIAIAEELRKQGCFVSFIIDNDIETINTVRDSGFKFRTPIPDREDETWKGEYFDIAVVNQLTTPFQQLALIKKHCKYLVTIDDTGEASKKLADLRINPLYFDESAHCDIRYIPLHPIFQKAHEETGVINDTVKHILVTLGGSDTYGLTPQIIEAFSEYPHSIRIKVIIGTAFKHEKELKESLSKSKRIFDIFQSVDIETMCKLIQWADIAICSAGNTLFEMMYCGTPVVVICGEPFEEETAYRLQNMGFGMVMPFNVQLDAVKLKTLVNNLFPKLIRQSQSQTGQRLVDGKGIKRITDKILNSFKPVN